MPIIFEFSIYDRDTAEQVGEDVVVFDLSQEVVIDDTFRDTSNYTIEVISGSNEISVREVIPPTDGLTTQTVILYVDRPTKGTHYRITTGALRGRDGSTVATTADFIGRRTKLETMMRGIPQHWDKRPDSVMRNFLAAISREDDRIGGGRDDRL